MTPIQRLATAYHHFATGKLRWSQGETDDEGACLMEALLIDADAASIKALAYVAKVIGGTNTTAEIARFNDAPGRTLEEILAVLQEAQRLAAQAASPRTRARELVEA
jgi:hypothetical protein